MKPFEGQEEGTYPQNDTLKSRGVSMPRATFKRKIRPKTKQRFKYQATKKNTEAYNSNYCLCM